MKNLITVTLFLLLPFFAEAQKISGQSRPAQFQIPQKGNILTATSSPIEMKIRQDITFSNVSQPKEFKIGQKINRCFR